MFQKFFEPVKDYHAIKIADKKNLLKGVLSAGKHFLKKGRCALFVAR